MQKTGGEIITDALTAMNIRTVFAVGGASHTHLLMPLKAARAEIVSSRHESGAVGAADGYARVKGTPGIALIIADQGLPNAIGGLAVAYHACSPVVVLVATAPRAHAEADRSVDHEQLALVAPVTKWARSVPSVERLDDYLGTALKHATAGRPAPVVLLIPMDILQSKMAARQPVVLPAAAMPHANSAAVKKAAELLAGASRPIVIVGGGAAWSGAGDALCRLSKSFSIPVFGNSLGRGQVPEDNKLSFSWPYGQIAARRADVVLVVGARLTQRLGLGLPPRFSADARFIQIDIDADAFHRNRPIDVPILADARQAVELLNEKLSVLAPEKFDIGWLHAELADRAARVEELAHSDSGKIHPLRLGKAIMERLTPDSQIVGDGADIQSWMYGAVRIRRPRGFLDHYPMGAMGSCTALAVGAAAAHKEKEPKNTPATVLITGDGSIGFHPAEIHAAVLANHHLIVIVGNDGAWGTELHGQDETIGMRINTELGVLPYHKLGEAFGATGYSVARLDQLDSVLDEAFSTPRVCVINVEIDPAAGKELKTNPTVAMIVFSDILDGQADLNTLVSP